MILTCYSATSVFSQPLIGYLSDLTGYKKIYLASGLALMGLSLFSIQFATSLIMIFPLTFLAGLGFSIYHPISMSLINTAYIERRGFGLGFHGLGGSLGRGV
ncbi:MAG: MFS transporter, partial [Candidatus Bathyarchaeia archaeon]